MTKFKLALYSQRLEPGQVRRLPAGPTVIYLREGEAVSRSVAGETAVLQRNDVLLATTPSQISCSHDHALFDYWTVSAVDDMQEEYLLLASEISLDPDREFLIRCDQVSFPPGGIAYLHNHAGPGIRRLIDGQLHVQTDGHSNDFEVGDSWFESGPIPVYAQASDVGATFIRVMVLPVDYKGRSSLTYVLEEDREKPKPQKYVIHVDEIGKM